MKRILAVSVLALLFAALLPFALPPAPAASAQEESAPQSTWQPSRDKTVTLTVLTPKGNQNLSLHDYLVGVVAAEMPAKFESEALKAQAVAARTYAMRGVVTGSKHADKNADVCTDPTCCQAWISDAEMRQNWGDDYAANLDKITAAVTDTDGEYLVSGGAPILAAFHSSSGGTTESSADVWGTDLPYLVSVSSPETEAEVPNFKTTMTAAPIDFRDTVLSAHPEADFTGAANTWIGGMTKDDSGRVKTVTLGGVAVTGEEMRTLFSLRSTEFDLAYNGNFVFSVTGNGHGVGMSQYGAQSMAKQGTTYRDILSHYYPGAELKKA